jgi:hypothetical protein
LETKAGNAKTATSTSLANLSTVETSYHIRLEIISSESAKIAHSTVKELYCSYP